MNKKQMPKRKNKSNQVSEPESVYLTSLRHQTEGKEIIISSFEEQEDANYLYWLSLTPVQRLELHYKMISEIYKDVLMKRKKTNKIIFEL